MDGLRRRRKAQILSNERGVAVLLVGFVALAVALATMCLLCHFNIEWGCYTDFAKICDGDSPSNNQVCSPRGQATNDPKLIARCCKKDNPAEVDPNATDCPLEVPGHVDVTSLPDNISEVLSQAHAQIKNANDLVGAVTPVMEGLSSGFFATAGDVTTTKDDPNAGGGGSGDGGEHGTKGKGGRGGGSGGTGTGGSTGSIGGGSTLPSEKTSSDTPLLAMEQSAAYSSSGGAAVATSKGKGLGSNGGITGQSGAMNFGSEGTAVEVMGSPDPADYFTKLGLDENIFKVIHKRYDNIHLVWTRTVPLTSKPAPSSGTPKPTAMPVPAPRPAPAATSKP